MNMLQPKHCEATTASATANPDDYDTDMLLDLDCEGLDGVKVEWLPRQDVSGRIFSGGRYVLEIESDGKSVTVWATPEQMEAIQKTIQNGMAGDPPRQEMLDWIDRYWTYVTRNARMTFEDEDELCYYQAQLREATDAWECVVAPYDCEKWLPIKYCGDLRIECGATFGAACVVIDNRIEEAWKPDCEAGDTSSRSERLCKYPGFTVRQRREGWTVREHQGKAIATCADKEAAERVAAALSAQD